ncbi:MAG: helix-turn-helix transcriptional regulator [Anaerolineae bacterium]|nr:helix-turn-helix transcriptional regulator [Anaerolineae bacterium]
MPGRGRGQGRGGGLRLRWGRRMRVIEPLMLLLLAQEPAHGYRLVERLAEDFEITSLPPQTVYRALQEMETAGWLSSTWDMSGTQGPPRKVYRLTPAGEAALESWSTEMESLRQKLDTFKDAYGRFRNR